MSHTFRRKGFSRTRTNSFKKDYVKYPLTGKERQRFIWQYPVKESPEKQAALFHSDTFPCYGNVGYLKYLTKRARRVNENRFCKKVLHVKDFEDSDFYDANKKRFIWHCF